MAGSDSTRDGSRFPRFFRSRAGLAAWFLASIPAFSLLAGCGMLPSRGESAVEETRSEPDADGNRAHVQPSEAGRFEEPGELDKMLDSRPIAFAAVKSAAPASAAVPSKTPAEAGGRGRFRIQVGAENDIDAAQSKKQEYERKLGGTVDVVFDAPYYKLRWGYFETKQDADDKILELSEFNIQGFVIRQ